MKYDDVVNFQRKNVYSLRSELITSDDVSQKIKKFVAQINQDLVDDCIPKNSYSEQWEIDTLEKELQRIYGLKIDIRSSDNFDNHSSSTILQLIDQKITDLFVHKEQKYGANIMRKIEKQIFLITLDSEWKDHLHSLDKLRQGINLRAYAQKDPLIEYKKDGFNLYEDMMLRIEEQVVSRLAHVEISADISDEGINLIAHSPKSKTPKSKTFESRNDPNIVNHKTTNSIAPTSTIRNKTNPQDRNPRDPQTWGHVGRNEPCPCGSGKKYKNCHGN